MHQLSKALKKEELPANVSYYYEELPEKVIQFGEGNFLRGFVDWMIHELNKKGLFQGKVVAIQPTPHGKVVPKLNAQDGLYTLSLRGIEHGELVQTTEIISSISRGINPYTEWKDVLQVAESPEIEFVFSNTTEAGLTYVLEEYDETKAPISFPGKLTAFLYHRYKTLNSSPTSGLVIIPCELVEDNGEKLREFVIQLANDWKLPPDFIEWVKKYNQFCNTLVDRIVTGYPTDEIEEYRNLLGYQDALLTTGEPYHLFVIEASEEVKAKIPFDQAGLNVKWADVTPYRELKVRLLNGPHTMMFAASYLSGVDTVREAMKDPELGVFIRNGIYQEIFSTVEMDNNEKNAFVHSVIERFLNPYNKHLLTDIGMNAVYKFKTRLIPTLVRYVEIEKKVPAAIAFSLAALIVYYRSIRKDGDFLIGKRGNEEYTIRDNHDVIRMFIDVWEKYDESREGIEQLVTAVLQDTELWGTNLNKVEPLNQVISTHITNILQVGMRESIRKLVDVSAIK